MFGLSATEILAVLIVALLVFGPKQLPKLANRLGRTLRELRQASQEIKAGFEGDLLREEEGTAPTAAAPGATPATAAPVPSAAPAPSAPLSEARAGAAALACGDLATAHSGSARAQQGDAAQPERAGGDLAARDLRRPDAGI